MACSLWADGLNEKLFATGEHVRAKSFLFKLEGQSDS